MTHTTMSPTQRIHLGILKHAAQQAARELLDKDLGSMGNNPELLRALREIADGNEAAVRSRHPQLASGTPTGADTSLDDMRRGLAEIMSRQSPQPSQPWSPPKPSSVTTPPPPQPAIDPKAMGIFSPTKPTATPAPAPTNPQLPTTQPARGLKIEPWMYGTGLAGRTKTTLNTGPSTWRTPKNWHTRTGLGVGML